MPEPVWSSQSSDCSSEHERIDQGVVEGVVVDAQLLFYAGKQQLEADVEKFILRLCCSNLQIGIYFTDPDLEKEALLKDVGVWKNELIFLKSSSSEIGGFEKRVAAWPVSAKSSVFLASQLDEALLEELADQCWNVIQVSSASKRAKLGSRCRVIEQLQDFHSSLALLNKRALGENLLVVAHIMKWSREKDFLLRGAFPLLSKENGLCFIPIHFERPLEPQLEAVDVVLQKVTDEISSISADGSLAISDRVRFSQGIEGIQRYVRENPHISVIDPVERILPLLDRSATRSLLKELDSLPKAGNHVVRLPRSLEVLSLDEPGLIETLESAKVKLPTIVKPKIACGASEAHTMAVVLRNEGYTGLKVPVPATIQEYIDHGKLQYKFYMVGNKLFYSRRTSTPNAAAIAMSLGTEDAAIVFDSLKPFPAKLQTDTKMMSVDELDVEAVVPVASWLRYKLGLTIIGFDVVVQADTGDHVIVDVNFFPSFKDVPDSEALPAFWEAIRRRHQLESFTK